MSGEPTKVTIASLRNCTKIVIAIGGDGTANAVGNGFFDSGKRPINHDAVMSFIPSGTGNVLSRSFSLPTGLEDKLKLFREDPRRTDVILARVTGSTGRTVSRIFLNAAELGLGARIIERSKKIRKVVNSRTISTFATLISTVPSYRSNECEISINDSGGLKVLDKIVEMNTGESSDDGNMIYQKSRKIAIRSRERDVGATVGGEPIGMLPTTFEAIPRALKFVY
jgi:diacylglycerol kinase family enzyme